MQMTSDNVVVIGRQEMGPVIKQMMQKSHEQERDAAEATCLLMSQQ